MPIEKLVVEQLPANGSAFRDVHSGWPHRLDTALFAKRHWNDWRSNQLQSERCSFRRNLQSGSQLARADPVWDEHIHNSRLPAELLGHLFDLVVGKFRHSLQNCRRLSCFPRPTRDFSHPTTSFVLLFLPVKLTQ